jgi:tetratricopeptide (TPR) repeat protein
LAAARYANAEALDYLTRALALTAETDLAGRYALLLAREAVYHLQGAREAQRQDLAALQALAERLGDDLRRAEVALRRANLLVNTGDPPAAIAEAQAAIAWAQSAHNAILQAEGQWYWGRAHWRQGEYAVAHAHFEEALELARAGAAGTVSEAEQRKLRQLEGHSLRALGIVAGEVEDYARSVSYYEQCLALYREIGDHLGQAQVLNNLGTLGNAQGDYSTALAYYEQALHASREIGARQPQATVLSNLGSTWNTLGNYGRARDYHQQMLDLARDVNAAFQQALALANLALAQHNLGEHETARERAQEALQVAQRGGYRKEESYAWTDLGHAREGLQQWDQAAEAYRHGLELRRELGAPLIALEPLAGWARACLAQGDLVQAMALVEQMVPDLERVTQSDLDEPLHVPWTCYRVLREAGDPRALAVLESAYGLLQASAAMLQDEEMRRSFLENVPWHREIMQEHARVRGDVQCEA